MPQMWVRQEEPLRHTMASIHDGGQATHVLLADEPTGALDSATGIKVLEALTQVNRTIGATTLVITHNAAIQEIADRVVRFANGAIASEHRNARRKPASAISW